MDLLCPSDGDVLRQRSTGKEVHVDNVCDGWVMYRVTDGIGGLLAAYTVKIQDWWILVEKCKEDIEALT